MIEVCESDAIKFFNEYGYLVIDSMRNTGKTTTLKKIIELNPNAKIGVFCKYKHIFDKEFRSYKNCTYISNCVLDMPLGASFDIFIGDEIHLTPNPVVRTACAYTNQYVIFSLNPYIKSKQINDLKKVMSKHQYYIEYGQYTK